MKHQIGETPEIFYLDNRTSSAESGDYTSSTIQPDCASNITKNFTVIYDTDFKAENQKKSTAVQK